MCNAHEAEVLDHIFGKTTYTAPATWYVGVCTAVAEDGTITGEPSGNNYARVAVTNNTTKFPNATAGAKSNGEAITFPQASGSWGTLEVVFLSSSDTGGVAAWYGDLADHKTIGNLDTLSFAVGDLDITMD
jgi:hypothetical protein